VAALMNYAATFAISYLISIYLQVVMGYSSQTAGIIMICQPAIMAILSPLMGRISDKYSPFKMSSLGMALCGVGTFMYIFIDQDSSVWLVVCALVVTGLGFSLFSSPNTNAVMSCVDQQNYGVASSILSTMRTIGHTLSMVVVTIMVSIYIGNMSLAEADPQLVVSVINKSFIVFTIVCIAGVFISLRRKKG
jgi:MFS family permease